MRVAPKGSWFIKCTNIDSGEISFPFYDGFSTKKEATEICNRLNQLTSETYHHEVVGKISEKRA